MKALRKWEKCVLFHIKSSFGSQIFSFLFWLFGHAEKWLNHKNKVNFKIKSQPGKQKIAMHLLPNISRSKGNQTVKLGQLIEYTWKTFFLEKSYTKYGGETIPWRVSKMPKLRVSLDQ